MTELLKTIQCNPCFDGTRLVGGTSLALQIGHRTSIDLDLFGSVEGSSNDMRSELRVLGTVSLRGSSRHIHRFLLDGVQVVLFITSIPG